MQIHDIHIKTAKFIFDKDREEITHEMRRAAKRINFGLIHGRALKEMLNDLERL